MILLLVVISVRTESRHSLKLNPLHRSSSWATFVIGDQRKYRVRQGRVHMQYGQARYQLPCLPSLLVCSRLLGYMMTHAPVHEGRDNISSAVTFFKRWAWLLANISTILFVAVSVA